VTTGVCEKDVKNNAQKAEEIRSRNKLYRKKVNNFFY
jgi:hypothetical protein